MNKKIRSVCIANDLIYIDNLLSTPNLKEEWQRRRRRMLGEKVDVTEEILRVLSF